MRDERIDFLRFLGLAMIILAHIEPPQFIYQLRNFDVPLMVLVAGLSFRASFKQEQYLSYVWNRIKRLVFPVWLFLSAYFLFILATAYPIAMPPLKTVLSSYLLLNGIGYVWIIRVFLLVALVSPAIYSFSKKQPSNYLYLAIVAVIYVAYEIVITAFMPTSKSLLSTLLMSTVFCLVPYAVVFAIGLRLPDFTRAQLIALTGAVFLVFIAWVYIHWLSAGKFIRTQDFKYPLQSYYLSYALLISFLMWMASGTLVGLLRRANLLPAILFIGQNSIWIYLWHIPLVSIIKLPFQFKYLAVFAIAVAITYLQTTLINNYIVPRIRNSTAKKNTRLLMTG